MKFLCAFDFDDTMITENSDYSVLKVLPDGLKLPKEIQDLYSSKNWIEYMSEIFMYFKYMGISKDAILATLEDIPLMPGFKELLHFVVNNDGDIVIISDSNSVFIEHILQHNKVYSLVKQVFTNPAEFKEGGVLKLAGYHKQDWCDLSTENLCKGHILEEFIEKQKQAGVKYHQVAYIGDGSNDYCPSLRLSKNDLIFARKEYRLDSMIAKNEEKVDASVVRWETGFDIINHLQSTLLSQESKEPG